MSGDGQQLWISLSRSESDELVQLARRCSVTRQALALHAVRQVLTVARGGDMAEVPPLNLAEGPADSAGVGVAVALVADDAAALDALCRTLSATREALAHAAATDIGNMRWRVANAPGHGTACSFPARPASSEAAKLNLSKARLIIDRLQFIAEWGLDDRSRAALAEIESLKTIPPF